MDKFSSLDCILLVDDDDACNFLNKMVIRNSKLDTLVKVSNNGQEALDVLANVSAGSINTEDTRQCGIIFLDINMPGMNGWEFLEEYKKLPKEEKSNTVVAVLSSSINVDDVKRAKEHPDVNEFISKPLTVKILTKLVETYFDI